MTDKEKKAMDDLTAKEISFEINWTPEQRKTFETMIGLTEFRENYIKVDTLINLVQKQEKVINEMAKFLLFDIDNDIFDEYFCSRIEDEKCKQIPDGHCEECIKQYFYRKEENNE